MFKKIENLLLEDKNGDEFVNKLALHSLYLLGFELLKDKIDSYFRDLHADWHEKINGKLEPVKYKYSYFSLENNEAKTDGSFIKLSDKKKLKKHYPELAKLFNGKQPYIINQIEEMVVKFEIFTRKEGDLLQNKYRLLRNDVGHNLLQVLLDDNFKEAFWEDILFIYVMYSKIDKWIFLNYEVTIDPESYQKFSEQELESAISMRRALFQKVLDKVEKRLCIEHAE
jgi:hypothetical protein